MRLSNTGRLVLFLLLLGAAVAAFVAFAGSDADDVADAGAATDDAADAADAVEPIPVETVTLSSDSVSSYLTATANLVAEKDVRILAEAQGRLARVGVEEGDTVSSGQVLAVYADDDAAIRVEKARVRSAAAAQSLARAERLESQGLLSTEAFEDVTLEQRVAEQELAEARFQLAKTTIRAPFSGRLIGRSAQPGQHVRPGDELFQIADFEPLIARVYLPEEDVLRLEEGRIVRLTLRADDSVRFDGRIRQIAPVVDTGTGTVKVTVEAVEPPTQVRPGAFVRVDVVREARRDVVVVPREAVVRELQKTYVFVAEEGIAKKREVELGVEEDGRVEVLGGAELGDTVVTAGQGGLREGSPVAPVAVAAEVDDTASLDTESAPAPTRSARG